MPGHTSLINTHNNQINVEHNQRRTFFTGGYLWHQCQILVRSYLFKYSINQIIAAKAILILYGTLATPYLYITSDNVFLKNFFIVIIGIVVLSDYRIFYIIFSQGPKYRLTSIIFILLISICFLVGFNLEYRKYMIFIILIFGIYVYKLDLSFLQRRKTDR